MGFWKYFRFCSGSFSYFTDLSMDEGEWFSLSDGREDRAGFWVVRSGVEIFVCEEVRANKMGF